MATEGLSRRWRGWRLVLLGVVAVAVLGLALHRRDWLIVVQGFALAALAESLWATLRRWHRPQIKAPLPLRGSEDPNSARTVTVERPESSTWQLSLMDVLLDGERVGTVSDGDRCVVPLPPERCSLQLRVDWVASPPVRIDAEAPSVVLFADAAPYAGVLSLIRPSRALTVTVATPSPHIVVERDTRSLRLRDGLTVFATAIAAVALVGDGLVQRAALVTLFFIGLAVGITQRRGRRSLGRGTG